MPFHARGPRHPPVIWVAPDMAPGTRPHMDAWSRDRRDVIRSQHLLLPAAGLASRVLASSLAATTVLLGLRLQIHTQRAPFDAALARAVRGS